MPKARSSRSPAPSPESNSGGRAYGAAPRSLALVGKPVVIAATGGGHRHALTVEHQLRPLFAFFCAHTIATSVYAAEAEFTDGVMPMLASPLVSGRPRTSSLRCWRAGMPAAARQHCNDLAQGRSEIRGIPLSKGATRQ